MVPFYFTERISVLPRTKAKSIVRAAKIAIAILFIIIMGGIAITTWLMFTSVNRLEYLAVLVLLGGSILCWRPHAQRDT